MTLIRFGSGRNFAGMDSHVLRPIITAFCLSVKEKYGKLLSFRINLNYLLYLPAGFGFNCYVLRYSGDRLIF